MSADAFHLPPRKQRGLLGRLIANKTFFVLLWTASSLLWFPAVLQIKYPVLCHAMLLQGGLSVAIAV